MLAILLSGLTACGGYSPVDLDVPKPDAVLTAPCPALQSDPGRALTQAEVEILWGRDREAARVCAGRHEALVDWLDGLVRVVKSE